MSAFLLIVAFGWSAVAVAYSRLGQKPQAVLAYVAALIVAAGAFVVGGGPR